MASEIAGGDAHVKCRRERAGLVGWCL